MKRLLLVALALAGSPATAAVQFIDARISVSTYGYLADPSQPRFGNANDSAVFPRNLTAETALIVERTGAGDTVEINHAARADMRGSSRLLLSATSSVTFDIETPGFVAGYGQTGAYFTYTFVLDRQTSITVDYANIKAINPLPAYNINSDPARLYVVGAGGFPPAFEFAAGPNSSGRLTATLASGRYSLNLQTILNGMLGWPADLGMASGETHFTSTDRFDIMFGSVPEPGSWAMMIVGFGLVGAAGRRQEKARCSAA